MRRLDVYCLKSIAILLSQGMELNRLSSVIKRLLVEVHAVNTHRQPYVARDKRRTEQLFVEVR
jgi:hypothetical protein